MVIGSFKWILPPNLQFSFGEHAVAALRFWFSISPTFTKLMRPLTRERHNVVSYLDDILIYHSNIGKHITGVRFMLETMRKFGLTKDICSCQRGDVLRVSHKIGTNHARTICHWEIHVYQGIPYQEASEVVIGFAQFLQLFQSQILRFNGMLTDLTSSKTTSNAMRWLPEHTNA